MNGEGKMKLTGMMDLIGLKCKGFTYNIAYDHEDEITGFVWMTSVMRSNFERHSQYITMDAMKKKTNTKST